MTIRRRNYTLVEMLIVCAIILVLVGIGSGGYALVQTKIKESRTTSLLKRIEIALENSKAKHGFYPPSNVNGEALRLDLGLDTTKTAQKNFLDDYRKTVDYESLRKNAKTVGVGSDAVEYVFDAYGYPIYYRCPGTKNRSSFDLISCGKDGKAGASGNFFWGDTANDTAHSLNTAIVGNVADFDNKTYDDIGNF